MLNVLKYNLCGYKAFLKHRNTPIFFIRQELDIYKEMSIILNQMKFFIKQMIITTDIYGGIIKAMCNFLKTPCWVL